MHTPASASTASASFTAYPRRLFIVLSFVSASAVGVAVWLSGARAVLHDVLIAAGMYAFWPFVSSVALLLFALVFALVSAWSADTFTRHWLQRVRDSWPWALALGAVLGCLSVWLLLALIIVPKETDTMQQLLEAQAALDHYYTEHQRYPEVAAGLASVHVPPHDAFGRALQYEALQTRFRSSYRLHSLGWDGRASDDDLCVSGNSRLQSLFERAQRKLARLAALQRGDFSWTDRLFTLHGLRCDER
ncbi:MAG: hypothetical protein RL701_6129 [Pseudomonadota bacterium]|jgi:hypothetical protein